MGLLNCLLKKRSYAFPHLFLYPATWRANVAAGAQAAILDYVNKSSSGTAVSWTAPQCMPWRPYGSLGSETPGFIYVKKKFLFGLST